jgi:hypothetical protein
MLIPVGLILRINKCAPACDCLIGRADCGAQRLTIEQSARYRSLWFFYLQHYVESAPLNQLH